MSDLEVTIHVSADAAEAGKTAILNEIFYRKDAILADVAKAYADYRANAPVTVELTPRAVDYLMRAACAYSDPQPGDMDTFDSAFDALDDAKRAQA